jgi:hypothetical protein
LFFGLAWLYLGGKGWLRKTAEALLRYLPKPVSAPIYFWTFLTGVLAIISLGGLVGVTFRHPCMAH